MRWAVLNESEIRTALVLRDKVWAREAIPGKTYTSTDSWDGVSTHYGGFIDDTLVAAFRIFELPTRLDFHKMLEVSQPVELAMPISVVGGLVVDFERSESGLGPAAFTQASKTVETRESQMAICVMIKKPVHFMDNIGWRFAGKCATRLSRPTNNQQYLFVKQKIE
jgi:hypothetical protein